jgi:5,10-methylenetetrahydromethanopterin reductase
MRFALDLSHHAWTRGDAARAPTHALEMARAADAGGIDAIWANEDPEGWDAFAVLSAVATVTSRAALGTGVTNPYGRHPNMLAASVATLDRLSHGRAILGLGRGQPEWHRDALGVDTGAPLAVLGETIALLREWWRPPLRASSPAGAHFAVRDWERVVHPLQESVPIYLAAAGPLALTLAGSLADGVIFNILTSEDALREAIPRVRDAATKAGRDPRAFAFVLRTSVMVVEDPIGERKALDRAKTLLALIATLPGMGQLVRTEGFDVPAILREVKTVLHTEEILAAGGGFPALRRQGDIAGAREAIPDELIRRLAIVGSLPDVRARLRNLAAIGVTHVSVAPPREATSAAAWRELLRELNLGLKAPSYLTEAP